jgi:hypothetical protein
MSIDSIRRAVEKRFIGNWTGTTLNLVRFSNAVFNPPEDSSWASLDIRWMPTQKVSISSNLGVRRKGLIVIDLYVPIDEGTLELATLADEAIGIYENNQFAVPDDAIGTYIQCMSADVRHIGVPNIQGTDPQWYKYSVRVEFFRDE